MFIGALPPLPPTLTSLEAENEIELGDGNMLRLSKSLTMPSTLTNLNFGFWSYLWLPLLPATLKTLMVSMFGWEPPLIDENGLALEDKSTNTTSPLSTHSEGSVSAATVAVLRFPEGLETLRIGGVLKGPLSAYGLIDHFLYPFDFFAPMPRLVTLTVSSNYRFHWKVLMRLPPSLRKGHLALTGFDESGFETALNPLWHSLSLVLDNEKAQVRYATHCYLNNTSICVETRPAQNILNDRIEKAKLTALMCPHPAIASLSDSPSSPPS